MVANIWSKNLATLGVGLDLIPEDVQWCMREILEGRAETERIKDGQVAINRLAGNIPALIVLDLHLPHVGGESILKQIRASENFAKVSVIVTSADAQMADDIRELADLVLLKPVGVDQLRELAKRMLPH